jgi:hypothetical protein
MYNTVTPDQAIEFLNGLLKTDPKALRALIDFRTPCNEKMAQHPTVQVHADTKNGPYKVGILGLLNGMFGVDEAGWGPIVMITDRDTDRILEFRHSKKVPHAA